MLRIVTNDLTGLLPLRVSAERMAGVRIAVEAREVAAGDLDSNPVPLGEGVARRSPELDRVRIDFSRLDRAEGLGVERPVPKRVAVPRTHHPFTKKSGVPVGMNVHQPHHPVRQRLAGGRIGS